MTLSCNWCGSKRAVSACAGCNEAVYCDAACQKQDWDAFHKHHCEASATKAAKYSELIGACVDPRSASVSPKPYAEGTSLSFEDPRATLKEWESIPVWREALRVYFRAPAKTTEEQLDALLNLYGNASIEHFSKKAEAVRKRLVRKSAVFGAQSEGAQRARALLELYFQDVAEGKFIELVEWNQQRLQQILESTPETRELLEVSPKTHRLFLHFFGMSYEKYAQVLQDYLIKEMRSFLDEQQQQQQQNQVPKRALDAVEVIYNDLQEGLRIPGSQFCLLLEYLVEYQKLLGRVSEAKTTAGAQASAINQLEERKRALESELLRLQQVEAQFGDASNRLSEANTSLNALKRERNLLRADLTSAKEQLDQQLLAARKTSKSLKDKNAALEASESEVQTLKGRIRGLNARIKAQEQRLTELETEAATKCDLSEVRKARAELSQRTTKLQETEAELVSVNSSLAGLRERYELLRSNFNALEKASEDTTAQLAKANRRVQSLENAQRIMVPAKKVLDEFKALLDSKDKQLIELRRRESEFDRSARDLQDAQERIARLEAQLTQEREARQQGPMFCVKPPSGTDTKRTRKLLALDGGGVKGLVMVRILRAIFIGFERLFDEADETKSNFTNYFDMVGGTSTGAIMAYACALKKMSLKKADSLYWDNIANIQKSTWSETLEQYMERPSNLINAFAPNADKAIKDFIFGPFSGLAGLVVSDDFGKQVADKAAGPLISWLWSQYGPSRTVLDRKLLLESGSVGLTEERDDIASAVAPGLSFEKFKTRPIEETYKQIFSSVYDENGQRVTELDRLNQAPFAYNAAKYDAMSLEERLMDSEYRPRTFSVTLNVDSATPTFCVFRNYETSEDCSGRRYNLRATNQGYLYEGVRASSAAPTYFAPFSRTKRERDAFPDAPEIFNRGVFVDGGVGNNNPALVALTESSCVYNPDEIQGIISLGCGQGSSPFNTAYAKFSGNPYLISEGKLNGQRISDRERLFAGMQSVQELVQGLMLGQLVFGREHSELAANLLESYGIQHNRLDPFFANGVPDLAETNEIVLLSMLQDLDRWIARGDGLKLVMDSRRMLFGDAIKGETEKQFLEKLRNPQPHEVHDTDTKLKERRAEIAAFRRATDLEEIIMGRGNVVIVTQLDSKKVSISEDTEKRITTYRVHWKGIDEDYDATYEKHETISYPTAGPITVPTTTVDFYRTFIPRVSKDQNKAVQRDASGEIEYVEKQLEEDPTAPGGVFDITKTSYGAHIPDKLIITAQASAQG